MDAVKLQSKSDAQLIMDALAILLRVHHYTSAVQPLVQELERRSAAEAHP